MSMQAINFALTLPVNDPGPRLTLICIAFHINYRSGDMFVGQAELAAEVRVSARTMRTYLQTLEDAGYITREARREGDHRGTDRIVLVGYLEWQHVLEHGGTIVDPATRKPVNAASTESASDDVDKPVDNQPANFAGRGGATGKIGGGLPAKTPHPTGNMLAGTKEQLNHKRTTRAREGACDEGATPSRASKATPRLVCEGDRDWAPWLRWCERNYGLQFSQGLAGERAMVVFASWPQEGSARPMLPPAAGTEKRRELEAARGLSETSKRMTGEAAE